MSKEKIQQMEPNEGAHAIRSQLAPTHREMLMRVVMAEAWMCALWSEY